MMSEQKIYYFDNNATTRIAPEVVTAMLPFLTEHWGNPSSSYRFGHKLAKQIETAREKIAALIHAEPRNHLHELRYGEQQRRNPFRACYASRETPRPHHGGGTFGEHQVLRASAENGF